MTNFEWRSRTQTRRIILHDSHTPRELPSAVRFMRAKGRTMGLLDVGYHYVIERDGRVVCCRPHQAMGSHTPGFNHDAIGVCLAGGCAGEDDFTDDQLHAVRQLCSYLQSAYGWGLKIQGHSEVQPMKRRQHSCPAFDVEAIREDVMSTQDHDAQDDPAASRDTGLSTQNLLILEYLQSKRTLSSLIAMVSLGAGSLSSRIAELRALGYKIKGEEAKDHAGRRYIKYTLADDAEEKAVA